MIRGNVITTQRCGLSARHGLIRFNCRRKHCTASREFIEEETLPSYHQKQYCPVHIGDLLGERYRILEKLGYGAYATVWLARDERCLYHAAIFFLLEC